MALSLKEVLAAKRLKPTSHREIEIELEPFKEKEEDLFSYKVTSIQAPASSLFLALYAPYLRNPYAFDFFIFQEYKSFLLDNKTYVLNTFSLLDIERIKDLYFLHLKPKTLNEITRLCYFLNHIHLNIPFSYQKNVEDIIQKISP